MERTWETVRDYRDTILLPETAFPMRGNLAQREPEILRRWEKERVYDRLLAMRSEASDGGEGRDLRYVFHDGPPYANGPIHHGHVLNKVLKDIVVKYQGLAGRMTKFIHGWDCHGLPIELRVERSLGRKKAGMSVKEVRAACRKEAEKWVDVQGGQFRRLGLFGTWDQPYLTLDPSYERGIMEALGAFVRHGLVYRGKKPVFWCWRCRTALAEAEVEYAEHESPSIYVKFPVAGESVPELARRLSLLPEMAALPQYALIWTTTPWTLAANLAIAVHPESEYVAVQVDGEVWLMAKDLVANVLQVTARESRETSRAVKGRDLTGMAARHPFADRSSPLLAADFVTMESGTGLVHIAPGHGADDYKLGQQQGLDVFAPVDADARFTDDVFEQWRGMHVFDANPHIVRLLAQQNVLANREDETLKHGYPHCWRCRTPIVFRATTQWFIALDQPMAGRDDGKTLRELALSEIDSIAEGRDLPPADSGEVSSGWIPAWGRDRIHGMLRERPDWCISRQRVWGVPVPALHCKKCGRVHLNEAVVKRAADVFGRKGSDSWYEQDVAEFVPPQMRCHDCGGDAFEKDTDILDVWFESGASFYCTMRDKSAGLGLPVDLYLEGSDQHRGWFHSSLLVGAALLGRAPYKRVLTHGFVCDDKGRPYSKSELQRRREAGEKVEYIEPAQIVQQQGAELLRLWVAYEDFRYDVSFSREHLAQVSEAYFKIRNTIRFMLGNLRGFEPQRFQGPLVPLDAWAQARLRKYLQDVAKAYERFDFRTVFHRTVELCVGEWSAFYLDVIKDRLYCDAEDASRRRSAQATLNIMARGTIASLAPILAFTADEAWRHLPGEQDGSVFLNGHIAVPQDEPRDADLLAAGRALLETRDLLNLELEAKVKAREIGHRREVAAVVTMPAARAELISKVTGDLAEAFAVSAVELREGDALGVEVRRSQAPRCARCWRHRADVGANSVYADLCERCAEVVHMRGTAS